MSTADATAPVAPVLPGPPAKVMIVRAPYYRDVVDGMTQGARRILDQAAASICTLDVAGAFELPQAIRIAHGGRTRYHGFVALGCVVRGETDHYSFICAATMQGLMHVALDYGLCLGSGLLTVDTLAQAHARSADDAHNKGAEAAAACLLQIAAARTCGAG